MTKPPWDLVCSSVKWGEVTLEGSWLRALLKEIYEALFMILLVVHNNLFVKSAP